MIFFDFLYPGGYPITGISKTPLQKPKISKFSLEISTKKHENSKSV